MGQAGYVLKSSAVFTGNTDAPFAGGVAVRGARIMAVGPDKYVDACIGSDTVVRDCGDKLIMPGLIDSHTHFALGALATSPDLCVNLADCTRSFDQCMREVVAWASDHPNNEWVLGVQVTQLNWEAPQMPTAAMIDAYLSDRPVVLQQAGLHTYSANTCAMSKAGVTRDTPDPYDGHILHDASGEPTGVFSSGAGAILTRLVHNPPLEKARQLFEKTARLASRLGLTSLGVVAPTFVGLDDPYGMLAELNRTGRLPLRMFLYTDLTELETKGLEQIRAENDHPGSLIRWKGFKQFGDGVCSDHTAWMLEPYSNDPSTCGAPATDPEIIRRNLLKACELGQSVRIHAIGDRAVRSILDCFEEAQEKFGRQGLRHCMEHNETIEPEDLPRYAELGVAPAMQPMHMAFDMAYLAKDDAVRPRRAALSWPIRSLLESGACVHLGTDFPVAGLEPMGGIHAAVYRRLPDGSNPQGWFAEERISLAQAPRAYTHGSAYAMGVDRDLGTLSAGKLADIVVLDRDLFACDPSELLEARSVLTMLDGRPVFEA